MPEPASAAFPTDEEIEDFVVGAGITVPADFDFSGLSVAVQAEIESRTGWKPFISGDPSVRTYDPPGWSRLWLGAGLVALTSVVVGGSTLAEGTAFRLLPLNAVADGRPYESIEFFTEQNGARSSVVITGEWGYRATLPDDVFQAALELGGAMAATSMLQSLVGGITKEKSGDDEVAYSDKVAGFGEAWNARVDRTLARYRRVSSGL